MKLPASISLAFMLITSQFLQGQTSNGLVLHLPFNGNVADISGNGYTVNNNGATLAPDRFGNENAAYYFDGSSTMTIDAAQNLPNVDSLGYTVSLWIKQDTAAADNGDILKYGNYGKGGIAINYKTDVYYLPKIYTTTGEKYLIVRTGEYKRLWEYKWHMLTLTYLNGIMEVFVNGCSVGELEVAGFSPSGYNFVLGNSVTCWIDDIKVYNRCLSKSEIAELSAIPGAVRATELNAYLLTDFEQNDLHPNKYVYDWHVYGHTGDDLSYCTTLPNPIKDEINNSDYVMASITFPTRCSGNLMSTVTPSRKQEYTVYSDYGLMEEHHNVLKWKILFYDSSIVHIDSMMWLSQNQITGDFQLYDGGACLADAGKEGGIYWGGGIFNENEIVDMNNYTSNPEKRLDWAWKYRVLPDTARVFYKQPIGKWTEWVYDIFWTKSDSGYWRLYKNGELISSKDHVQTLPDCAPATEKNGFTAKFGQYTRWNDYTDNEIDSLALYYDDIELFIDPEKSGISISDICPQCSKTASIETKKYNETDTEVLLFPIPVSNELHIGGEASPSSITIYTLDGRQISHSKNTNTINLSHLKQGIYIAVINVNGTWVTKKIIKE